MRTWLARLGLLAALLLLAMAYDVPSSCGPSDAACQAATLTNAPPDTAKAEQTSFTNPEAPDGLGTARSHGTPVLDDVVFSAAFNAAYTVDLDIADLSLALSMDQLPDASGPPVGFSLPSQGGGRSEPASAAFRVLADELGACTGDVRCFRNALGGGSPATLAAAPGGDQPTTPIEGQNVPEPSVILLLAISLVAVGIVAHRPFA